MTLDDIADWHAELARMNYRWFVAASTSAKKKQLKGYATSSWFSASCYQRYDMHIRAAEMLRSLAKEQSKCQVVQHTPHRPRNGYMGYRQQHTSLSTPPIFG